VRVDPVLEKARGIPLGCRGGVKRVKLARQMNRPLRSLRQDRVDELGAELIVPRFSRDVIPRRGQERKHFISRYEALGWVRFSAAIGNGVQKLQRNPPATFVSLSGSLTLGNNAFARCAAVSINAA
jgi:hypothetical protein